MSVYHQAILNSLPDATRETKTAKAYLFDYNQTAQGQYLWGFLYNPSTLEFSRSAKYSESQTLSAKKQDLQYGYTGGKTLTINEIVLDSWQQGKTIQPLLDGIEKLLECDINKKQYSPPILSFVFGSRRFGPCVLTNVKWTETGWLGGAPARATMSLSLLEIPEPMTKEVIAVRTREIAAAVALAKQQQGQPRMELTQRQSSDVINEAKAWLTANVDKFDPKIVPIIKSKNYTLKIDSKLGLVYMFDSKGNKVRHAVASWDGKKFK